MKKLFLISAMALIVSNLTFAGGLLTNTNQHILFLRNPARGASTQIDALYSNPAGISFMKEGFHLSLNSQSAFQTRTIHSTYAPFAMYGGEATKKFKGEASAPIIPSLFAVYKREKWAFGANFAVTGGGGKATFNKGLGSFESQVATLPALLSASGIPTNKYSVDSYMEGKQMIFGFQVGAAYRINEHLSAYAGVRMNYVSNGYVGYIRNIQANVGNGEMVNVNNYFTAAATAAMAAAEGFLAAGDMENYEKYLTQAGVAKAVAEQTKDKQLDCDQTGWGVTPVLGVDFNMGKWNIGVKYEFKTSLNVENKTKVDDTGLFKDGVNTPHDIPSLLSVGVAYEILPTLRASVGYHHFFDKNAEMASNKQKHIDHGTHEFMGGIEWDINRIVQISGGMQRTDYGVGDGYQSDM
ncbi:hypothetical protein LJC05_02635, partial [Bacteroides sp. OttesenSCG-928-J23]|nr:hypothetical protein [Bacteroides sp. OttesenSCG-928-J23]